MLQAIARLAIAAPRRIIAVGILVFIAAAVFGIPVAKSLSPGGFQDPNSESAHAIQVLTDKFGQSGQQMLIVVTAPERVADLQNADWLPARVTAVVAGGEIRAVSVANGVRELARLDPDGGGRPVLVHDGARPLASPGLVSAVAEATAAHGAAIPVLAVAETVKRVGEGLVLETVDRLNSEILRRIACNAVNQEANFDPPSAPTRPRRLRHRDRQ